MSRRRPHPRPLAALLALGGLAACTVGPDYKRPSSPIPAQYKEDGWKLATPADAIDRGAWWAVYGDPVLDGLERQIDVSNQSLKAAEAAYRQSSAIVAEARAGYFPTVTLDGSGTRSGVGPGTNSVNVFRTGITQNQFAASAQASWDLDVWGKIRRTVEGDIATAQASAGTIASARLSAQATLASDYYQLRSADEQKRILDASVLAFTQSLAITRNQYNAGVASAADVAQAQAQLENTRAQSIAVGVQRAQFEHAIAVLIGKPPGEFSIAPIPYAMTVPVAPTDLPSALLERRPDIAIAERQMAAANAQIGVALAAYYPDLTLSASYGFQAEQLANLFRAANKVWSFGPQLTQIVFNGGLTEAQVAAARAGYDQTIANYRQTVLAAFQQVEDDLSGLRILAQQSAVEVVAVDRAREAERVLLNQYKAGTVAYTSVVTAQTTRLTDELTALTITQNRLTTSVALIQALGGGWDASQLPTSAQIDAANDAPPTAPAAENSGGLWQSVGDRMSRWLSKIAP